MNNGEQIMSKKNIYVNYMDDSKKKSRKQVWPLYFLVVAVFIAVIVLLFINIPNYQNKSVNSVKAQAETKPIATESIKQMERVNEPIVENNKTIEELHSMYEINPISDFVTTLEEKATSYSDMLAAYSGNNSMLAVPMRQSYNTSIEKILNPLDIFHSVEPSQFGWKNNKSTISYYGGQRFKLDAMIVVGKDLFALEGELDLSINYLQYSLTFKNEVRQYTQIRGYNNDYILQNYVLNDNKETTNTLILFNSSNIKVAKNKDVSLDNIADMTSGEMSKWNDLFFNAQEVLEFDGQTMVINGNEI